MAGKLSRGKRGLGGAAALAVAAGRRSAEADIKVEEDNVRRENSARLLSLDVIKERPAEDTRPVDPDHVSSLVESIRLVGLIQPIYLDREFRLVAGAHRLNAFRELYKEDPQAWSKIPVVVDPDLDAAKEPEKALVKEIAENEKRSNLTPAQVQAAAERLIASDPRFTRKAGRLKRDERALTPFLASTFGVSTRYVRSLLNADTSRGEGEGSQVKKTGTKPELSIEELRARTLKKISKQARRWRNDPVLASDQKLLDHLDKLIKVID